MKIASLGVAVASGPGPSARSSGAFSTLAGKTLAALAERPVPRDLVSPAPSRERPESGSDLRTLDGMPVPVFLFPVTVTAPILRDGASGSREAGSPSPTSSVSSDPSTPTAAPPASTTPDPTVTEVGDSARFGSALPADASAPSPAPTTWAKFGCSAPAPATTVPPPELVAGAALREPWSDLISERLEDVSSVTDVRPDEPASAPLRAFELPMTGVSERRMVDTTDLTAPPPLPDEFLPPASVTDDLRIRIDADLSVHVARHGQTVDVRLGGTPDAVLPLMSIGAELGSSLADGGFDLGHFGSGDEPPPRPETEAVPESVRRSPPRVRSGRYA